MIPKPIHEIGLTDLQGLVDVVREEKTLEFKLEMPGKSASDFVPFLASVSSLANSAGGDFVLGIATKDGLADAVPGIAIANLDAEKLRIEQLLANGLEPRLPHIDINPVECANGRYVIVIRVARSWVGPHRVKANDKFYGRNSAGKYPLDVGELRTAFTLSGTIAERISRFQADRLIKIAAGEAPLPMHSAPAMVIHLIPLPSFADGRGLDIVQRITNGHVMPLPPGRIGHPNNYTTNLDGFLIFPNAPEAPAHAYSQVFRTGAVEGVDTLPMDDTRGSPFLPGPTFENTIVGTLRNYLMFAKDMGIPPPYFIFLSFCGVRGCHLRTRTETGVGYYSAGPLRDDTIVLPEVMIDSDSVDVTAAMRLTFNTIWNAFGFGRSDKYNAKGEWIGVGG